MEGKTTGQFITNVEVADTPHPFTRSESRRCWKNLLALSISFTFVFTSFNALQNLESSINESAGLGVTSLSIIYGCFILSCLVAPNVVTRLGTKRTIFYSMLFYTMYTASNLFSSFYTLIPAAACLGLAAGTLWTSQGSYLTTTALKYAEINCESKEVVVNYFNGIFFMFFLSSQIWGNLLSSYMLITEASENISADPAFCGTNFCPGQEPPGVASLIQPPRPMENNLVNVYLACGVVGAIIVLFVMDELPSYHRPLEDTSARARLTVTLRLLGDHSLYLLVPLMMYTGVEMAYIAGDFTQAFISCSLGVHYVGYIMLFCGVMQATASLILGRMRKYIGRFTLFNLGAIIHFGLLVLMFYWEPQVEDLKLFFVVAAMWGFADAIWQTQVSSLLGVLYCENQEAAFSNYRLWQSLGSALTFAYSNYLCTGIKIHFNCALLIVSMGMYIMFEFRNKHIRALRILMT
ncbi:protein unc-93 homolog A-like [Saccoglossus kowalevskii]|uniref:Protein unc-93 homolog A-like n=1 Tax=Saccoglossus kowalevskii TaxID=10224 RepID=A0ABM0GUN2_SACKO|nr:PREDICTED: protein unc-93 homolog A-like [Saccoglossus kowalevskii]